MGNREYDEKKLEVISTFDEKEEIIYLTPFT